MAYSVWQTFVTNDKGNVLSNAKIDVFRESDGSRVTDIYEDKAATSPLGNPFNATGNGFVKFYAPASGPQGYKITATSDDTTIEFRHVLIGEARSYDVGTDSSEKLLTRDMLDTRFYPNVQDNLNATSDPTVNDDTDAGYSIRSLWFNVSTDEVYRCVDDTAGAAVWVNTSLELSELGSMATREAGTGAQQFRDNAENEALFVAESDQAWIEKSADFTAAAHRKYRVDTSTAAVAVTIPAALSDGDQILLADAANTWGTNAVTLSKDGAATWSFASGATTTLSQSGVIAVLIYDSDSDVVQVFELATPDDISWAEYNKANSSASQPNASGNDAVAIANGAEASGDNAIAIGFRSLASGQNSVCIAESEAKGNNSVVVGESIDDRGNGFTVLVGQGITAYGSRSIGVGLNTIVKSDGVALGYDALANPRGVAMGYLAKSFDSGASLGSESQAYSDGAAVGAEASAQTQAVALGRLSEAQDKNAVALGYRTKAKHKHAANLCPDSKTRWEEETLFRQIRQSSLPSGNIARSRKGNVSGSVQTTNGTSGVSVFTNGLLLPADTIMRFKVEIIALDEATNDCFQQEFSGLIRNRGGTTAFVGSVTSQTPIKDSAMAVSAAVNADDSNDSLDVAVTGESGKDISWFAHVSYYDATDSAE